MTPDEYCQDRTAKSGSSFYYSFLFLPETQRRGIMALYAFCREVDDIVDNHNELSIAQQKLDWWRTEIERLYSGTPQHPVTRALHPLLENFQISKDHLHEVVNGMEMDLNNHSYANFEDLYRYCYRVASVVGLMSAEIFGYSNPQTRLYAEELGIAFQLTNIIRDIHEDAQRHRIYLPQDELKKFNVGVEQLSSPDSHDQNVLALLNMQINRAESYYRKAFDTLPKEDRGRQRSGIIMAHIYRKILNKIKRDPVSALSSRVTLSPLRKLWIAWRTYRKERKQYGIR